MTQRVDKQYQKFVHHNGKALVEIGAPSDTYMPAAGCTDIDETNPRSVINLVPKWFKCRVREIPQHFFEFTEEQLVGKLYLNRRPDPVANRLRIQFWEEYDRVQSQSLPQMELDRVTERVCTRSYFSNLLCADQLSVVYLLTPPTSYILTMKECLQMGVARMREVMAVSPVDQYGAVNEKLAEVQHRMFMTLDQRINGAVAQRIDQRILTANVSPEQAGATSVKNMSLADIQRRIHELEQSQATATLPPAEVKVDLMRDVINAEADTVSRDLDAV